MVLPVLVLFNRRMRKIQEIPKEHRKEVESKLELIADKIKSARKTKKLSQEALAEAAGISPTMIQSIEQGRRVPSLDLLLTIFAILKIEILK